ncbi:MAG: hypothetical protein PHU95_00690 [Candidatus Thermoplasmatota archaeon]|nr:hypothetical protein [Candidatus Thermoplasmatota archaeon]MDD5777954.1 hypothetical protein [Candidatus Thermoplasmatota archaeon]
MDATSHTPFTREIEAAIIECLEARGDQCTTFCQPPREKIKIKEVVIEGKEGIVEGQPYPRSYPSIREAEEQLIINAHHAPPGGAYDKHWVTITWEDGRSMGIRMDVMRLPDVPVEEADVLIGKHLRDFLHFTAHSDPAEWKHITDDDRMEALRFLTEYEIGDETGGNYARCYITCSGRLKSPEFKKGDVVRISDKTRENARLMGVELPERGKILDMIDLGTPSAQALIGFTRDDKKHMYWMYLHELSPGQIPF